MKKIYLIHENKNWLQPLESILKEKNIPYDDWLMVDREINLYNPPPEGIFFNRMSASSHSRGNRYSPELTTGLISWLEANDRFVVNGSNAQRLELSKMVQYSELNVVGLKVPNTICSTTLTGILEAAKILKFPLIIKHNRAGMGIGVRLFHSIKEMKEYLYGESFENSVDGITLIQNYISSPDRNIIRIEFVDKKFLYAVQVNTENGFELCPADECNVEDLDQNKNKNVALSANTKFKIIENFLTFPYGNYVVKKMQKLMENVGIDIASFELVLDKNNDCFVYDINVNTNYNSSAEKNTPYSGSIAVANFLKKLSITN